MFGRDSRVVGDQLQAMAKFSWPDSNFIERRTGTLSVINMGVPIGERMYFFTSLTANTLREVSLTNFTVLAGEITLSGLTGGNNQFIYNNGTTLYAKKSGSSVVKAYSASGTGTKTEDASKNITITSAHSSMLGMFEDDDYVYFLQAGITLRAYSKTGRVAVPDKDLTLTFNITGTSAAYYGSVLFVPWPVGGYCFAFVKTV